MNLIRPIGHHVKAMKKAYPMMRYPLPDFNILRREDRLDHAD